MKRCAVTSYGAIHLETDLFQVVKKRTAGDVGWERIEPRNESGFPDAYFVLQARTDRRGEGTVEFKYKDCAGEPLLDGALTRGNQKAGLIEYHQMGGNRRWFLTANLAGVVRLYTTAQAYAALRGAKEAATVQIPLDAPDFSLRLTLALEYPNE